MLRLVRTFLIVILLIQGVIVVGTAVAWRALASPELVFQNLMPPDHLSFYGREGVILAAQDLRDDLAAICWYVWAAAAVTSLAWVLFSGFARVRTPNEVYTYRAYWWLCMGIGLLILGGLLYLRVLDHPDLTLAGQLIVSCTFAGAFLLLAWPLGTLWLTPRVLKPAVPLGARVRFNLV